MSEVQLLPFTAALYEYQAQAEQIYTLLHEGDETVAWRFKWEHPDFKGKGVEAVDAATLTLEDAMLVVAREYHLATWNELASFADAVQNDPSVARFETAVEAVIAGKTEKLRSMLAEYPALVTARSLRRHHATLLHYIAANGVENHRQRTPPNAVEIAKLLLGSGAQVDAPADMYDAKCDTMTMLVSSSPPYVAGLQEELAETLLDYGAAILGSGTAGQSPLKTSLLFGFLETARMFVRRGAPIDELPIAAGLGLLENARRLLPTAGPTDRHTALALAAQHGQTEVVRLLLDSGEDPSRFNPKGFHDHSTPLHQAIWFGHLGTVELLVERGARLDIVDAIYQGTPLDWAHYGERTEIVEHLKSKGAPK